jgi:multisubunit Na+/H+ antiporter MnhE subunit
VSAVPTAGIAAIMSARSALPRGALELGCWWGALMGGWLVTLSSVSLSEFGVAAGAALASAVAAVAARKDIGRRWALPIRWARWFVPLPRAVATDTIRVLFIPPRRMVRGRKWDGEFREQPMPAGESAATALTRRAVATLLISSTPGTFVVDAEPDEETTLVHSLVGGTTAMERMVSQ